MDTSIASYELRVDGWNWVYELFPGKVLAIGVKGEEQQHFEVELKHCSDVLDHGVTEYVERYPARFLIVYVAILVGTVLFMGTVIVLTTVLDVRLPGNHQGKELIAFTVALVFLESLLPPLLSWLLKKRGMRRYVTLKRVSDGGPQITLHSALDPDETFEEFAAQVLAAIRSQHWADSPPNYSIQK